MRVAVREHNEVAGREPDRRAFNLENTSPFHDDVKRSGLDGPLFHAPWDEGIPGVL